MSDVRVIHITTDGTPSVVFDGNIDCWIKSEVKKVNDPRNFIVQMNHPRAAFILDNIFSRNLDIPYYPTVYDAKHILQVKYNETVLSVLEQLVRSVVDTRWIGKVVNKRFGDYLKEYFSCYDVSVYFNTSTIQLSIKPTWAHVGMPSVNGEWQSFTHNESSIKIQIDSICVDGRLDIEKFHSCISGIVKRLQDEIQTIQGYKSYEVVLNDVDSILDVLKELQSKMGVDVDWNCITDYHPKGRVIRELRNMYIG